MTFKRNLISGLSLATLLTSPVINERATEYQDLVQIIQPAYCQQDQITESFNAAQKDHIQGDLEDAKKSYDFVVRNFPKTDLAAEASLRCLVIDFVLARNLDIKIAEEGTISNEEIKKAIEETIKSIDEIVKSMNDGSVLEETTPSLETEYMKNAYFHFKEKTRFYAEREKIAQLIAKDYSIFETNYVDRISLPSWKIPNVPADAGGVLLQILKEGANTGEKPNRERLHDIENKLYNKICYNARIDDFSTNGKIDPLKLKLNLGMDLYQYRNTTAIGKAKLKEIVESTKNDPNSPLLDDAKHFLESEPLYISEQQITEFWNQELKDPNSPINQ